jgi:hypothetical protein
MSRLAENSIKNMSDSFENLKEVVIFEDENVDKRSYNGSWSLLDEEFRENLKGLIEENFNTSALTQKRIFEHFLTGKEYNEYLKAYFKHFQQKSIPDAKSIYDLTVSKRVEIALTKSKHFYHESIKNFDDIQISDESYSAHLESEHNKHKASAVVMLEDNLQFMIENDLKIHVDQLKADLDDFFSKTMSKIMKKFNQSIMVIENSSKVLALHKKMVGELNEKIKLVDEKHSKEWDSRIKRQEADSKEFFETQKKLTQDKNALNYDVESEAIKIAEKHLKAKNAIIAKTDDAEKITQQMELDRKKMLDDDSNENLNSLKEEVRQLQVNLSLTIDNDDAKTLNIIKVYKADLKTQEENNLKWFKDEIGKLTAEYLKETAELEKMHQVSIENKEQKVQAIIEKFEDKITAELKAITSRFDVMINELNQKHRRELPDMKRQCVTDLNDIKTTKNKNYTTTYDEMIEQRLTTGYGIWVPWDGSKKYAPENAVVGESS